jgi:DNA-binding IclR family transcriptional regulator
MDRQSKTSEGTQSLRRAVGLLRVLSTHMATGWRLSDLAERTGLDHTTVHRMLAGLAEERLVTRVDGTRRYTLGPLAYELGVASSRYFALDRVAAERLKKLAAETRDIVFLNVRSGFDSVCIARYEVRNSLKAYAVEVGTRRPLILSAGGVAMLVQMPRAERLQVERENLQSIAGGESREAAIRRMLRRSQQLGYGLNFEDLVPGIAAIGVAVQGPDANPLASISIASPRDNLPEGRRALLLERMREEADLLATQLHQFRYA